MKNDTLRGAISCVLVLVILSLLSAATISRYQPEVGSKSTESGLGTINCAMLEKQDKGFREALVTDPVAFFTMILAVFTIGLAGVTVALWQEAKNARYEQADLTRKSLEKAERSVRAAERALEGSDPPFMSVIPEIVAIKQRMIGGHIILQFMQGERVISYSLINYGKSPAVVLDVYRKLTVSTSPPRPIAFPRPQSDSPHVQIVGPDKITQKYFIDSPETIAAGGDSRLSWADHDSGSNDVLWLSFQIRYRDPLGTQFVSGHTFAFDSCLAEFYPRGGTEYNYRRKIDFDEVVESEIM